MNYADNQKLSVKIVTVDYYLSKPIPELHDVCYSSFRSLPIYNVPVIRIFGSTSEGIKICVHVHGVFPYIFIPNWENELLENDLHNFAVNLDKAINLSFVRSSSNISHVYQITAVSGRPFYGYYEYEKSFLKIEFYNPAIVKRATDLLQNGAVHNTKFQPYEAHVPYILQFFIDNNLYGMSHVTVKFYQKRDIESNIDYSINYGCNTFKQSYCKLEVDVKVTNILNNVKTADNIPNNPGLAFIWEEEKKLRRHQRRVSQITPNLSLNRPESLPSRTELYFKKKIADKLRTIKELFKTSKHDQLVLDEQNQESLQNSSSDEFNSQSKSILKLFEQLFENERRGGAQDKNTDAFDSSEVVIDSDEGTSVKEDPNLLINFKPIVKLLAEEDSILGNHFSDEENDLDENDHYVLSQSLIDSRNELFSSNDNSETEIPQLDGADKCPKKSNVKSKCRTEANSSPTNSKFDSVTKGCQSRARRTYNLRSKIRNQKENDTTANKNVETNQKSDVKKARKQPTKLSPKKPYPQLEIDTQKSPKSVASVRLPTVMPQSPTLHTLNQETDEPMILDSPTTNANRKNDSKRLYPQLKIIKKSPKMVDVETEITGKKLPRRKKRRDLKKRRINFDHDIEETKCDLTPDLGIMSLMTTKWKKQNVKSSKLVEDGISENDGKQVKNESSHYTKSVETNFKLCSNINDSSTNFETFVTPSEYNSQISLKINSRDPGHEYSIEEERLLAEEMQMKTTEVCDNFENYCIMSIPAPFRNDYILTKAILNENKPENVCISLPDTVTLNDESEKTLLAKLSQKPDELKNDISLPDTVILTNTIEEKILETADEAENKNTPLSDTVILTDDNEKPKVSEMADEAENENTPLSDTVILTDDNEKAKISEMAVQAKNENTSLPDTVILTDDNQKMTDTQILTSQELELGEDTRHIMSHTHYTVNQVTQINKKINFALDNSIWDSLERSYEEEQIRSFYDDNISTLNNVTSLPSHDNSDIIQSDIESSPIAKVLTPQSEENELVNFYDSESPINNSSLETERNISSECSQNTNYSYKIVKSSPILMNDSDSSLISSPVLHSTPQNTKLKKSPSPTYTPILKKLMLKKVKAKKGQKRRRISSARFQSEPFLPNIKEEEEQKFDMNTSISLLTNTSAEKPENDHKLSNSSRYSSLNGASCQIDGVTLENTGGFKMNLENLQDTKVEVQHQFITAMSMELFIKNHGDLNPNPECDLIQCLFYSIFHDAPNTPNVTSGFIIVDHDNANTSLNGFNCEKIFVQNEIDLFDTFISIVRKYDPDMFIGYEIEMLSWGYFIERGRTLQRNCEIELSRVKPIKTKIEIDEKPFFEESEYSTNLKLVGRIVLNVWRLMRHEISLQSYTFENIIFHVLHQRVPQHSFKSVTNWWKNPIRRLAIPSNPDRWIVIDYYLLRAECNILLLQQLDFFGRTSELARLFGIQFYEVLSRGSQFRVESMMLRLTKAQNFIAVSPSTKQRAGMKAPESLPLIMEPESKFYLDPVIVLDFQSLYPSIIIAYNYCFSTCLGRIQHLVENETFEFGCVRHTVPVDLLLKLEPFLNISPSGIAFVDQTIRKGILPSMLEEILETRLMVKKSLKENKENSILKRVLHARQLGLKLIANVTYGYTSANFSGRMPCIEVGDSVVSKGRETLERAIELIKNTQKWSAKVIYGDTDSIFVLVPNRTKEEAFRIGAEIAEAVTNDNPKPVKLKLEKVYLPCILQTKKRYVGYMYENCDQQNPVYDAKGIETVRRDGCPAISKILEKSLKLLFENKNSAIVKHYVQRQFTKLVSGRVSIQELTFAREYRGMNNYKPTACVPALLLAKQALMRDKRAEPRIKERVRYVLVAGPPGVPLIQLVRTPQQFLETSGSIINVEYYITRAIIPALKRCFNLLDVNIDSWYVELPRKQKSNLPTEGSLNSNLCRKNTISHYFATSKCIVCKETVVDEVCKKCEMNPQRLALVCGSLINSWQRKNNYISKICTSCCGRSELIKCVSLDCPMLYVSHLAASDLEQIRYVQALQQKYLNF